MNQFTKHKRSAIKKKKRRMAQHAKATLDVQRLRPYKIGGYSNAR